MKEILQ